MSFIHLHAQRGVIFKKSPDSVLVWKKKIILRVLSRTKLLLSVVLCLVKN